MLQNHQIHQQKRPVKHTIGAEIVPSFDSVGYTVKHSTGKNEKAIILIYWR